MIEEDYPEKVTIDMEEYERLLGCAQELDALYEGGVDNWEWYSESLRNAGLLDDD